MRFSLRTLGVCVLFPGMLWAAGDAASVNIARDKAYTMYPPGSYYLCTDAEDVVQLTDGKFTQGGFWKEKAAVGWKSGTAGFAVVVLDLGERQAISKVVVSSVERSAVAVNFPGVFLAVSDDGEKFTPVGVNYQPPASGEPNETVRAKIVLEGFLTRGRYLAVALRNQSPPRTPLSFFFADEVEVYGSELDANTGDSDPRKMTREEWLHYLNQSITGDIKWTQVRDELQRRLTGLSGEQRDGFAKRLEQIEQDPDLESRQREGAKLRAEIWAAKFPGKSLLVWPGRAWGDFTPLSAEPEADDKPQGVTLAGGSYGVGVWNLANPTLEPLTVKVELPADAAFCRLRESYTVRSVTSRLVGDALPLLKNGALDLQPGEARQLWIQIDGKDLPVGKRTVPIKITANGAEQVRDLVIDRTAFEFPKTLPLSVGSWSYLNVFPLTRGEFGPPAVKDMEDHYINAYVYPPSTMPSGRWDAQGKLQGELNFDAFDKEFEQVKFASTHLVFFGWKVGKEKIDGGFFSNLKWNTPEWKAAVTSWLQAFQAHLEKKGLRSDQIIYYPLDEYIGPFMADSADIIKAALPGAKVICLPRIKNEEEELKWIKACRDKIDIWMPGGHLVYHQEKILQALKDTGRPVWLYDAIGPAKDLDAYAYYRLPFWLILQKGLTGNYFWSYNDAGYRTDNAWSDTDNTIGDFAVIYTTKHAPEDVSQEEPVIPSRRWEAWRQGVIDYVVVNAAMERAKKSGSTKETEALCAMVKEVLDHRDDPVRADEARAKMLADGLAGSQ